jgi:hypothetical protein
MNARHVSLLLALVLSSCRAGSHSSPASDAAPGYSDTPFLPRGEWRVHDSARPRPPLVDPRPYSPVPVPKGAIVLFDGTDLSRWKGADGPARWKVENGCAEINGTGTIETKEAFGDCQLHLEFATPSVVVGHGQERGNSGVFFMGRYEVQVLDSFDNPTYADGQAAALYGQVPPLVNASRPPGEWQTYDIVFRAPRFDGDALVSPAYVTVVHNGIVVQDHVEFLGATRHREVATYASHASELPLALQDHGCPVRWRNLWIVRL